MARSTDYLLDSEGDLAFSNGDLAFGESDEQHVQDTINAEPGWWKQYPVDGVKIRKYLGGNIDELELKRAVRIELKKDGYRTFPEPLVFFDSNGRLNINPNAKKI